MSQGQTDQGTTTQPPSSDDNNKPTKPKLPKEGDTLELEPQTDDSTKQSKGLNINTSPIIQR